MTASSSAYIAFVKEQLAPLREMASARFFGGVGFAVGGVQFAMLMDGSLYFAVSDATRPRYEALGSRCFSYNTRKGRVEVTRYYEVPGEIVEDPEQLLPLAHEAIEAARAHKKRGRTRR